MYVLRDVVTFFGYPARIGYYRTNCRPSLSAPYGTCGIVDRVEDKKRILGIFLDLPRLSSVLPTTVQRDRLLSTPVAI